MGRHWMPWRPDVTHAETDDDCEDPDRIVLADDVTQCLFVITAKHMQFDLVCALLQLLGVDVPHLNQQINLEHSDMPFGQFLDIPAFAQSSNNLMHENSVQEFILNVIELLSPSFDDPQRSLLLRLVVTHRLALLCHNEEQTKTLKTVKKWLKSKLKEDKNRNNLTLWLELSGVDSRLGNTADALHVITTALKMSMTTGLSNMESDALKQLQVCSLFAQYVEITLGFAPITETSCSSIDVSPESFAACVRCLACMVSEGGVTDTAHPTAIAKLRAKNAFQQYASKLQETYFRKGCDVNYQDYVILCHQGSIMTVWLKCFAYFLYCLSDFDAARSLYESALETLKTLTTARSTDSCIAQLYHQKLLSVVCKDWLALCKHRSQLVPGSFRLLRHGLSAAVEALPHDSQLMRLYVVLESKAGLARQLRQFFHRLAGRGATAYIWLSVILAEMLRLQQLGKHCGGRTATETGISHQLRAWFEAAVDQQPRCPLLWRLYSFFEVRTREPKTSLVCQVNTPSVVENSSV